MDEQKDTAQAEKQAPAEIPQPAQSPPAQPPPPIDPPQPPSNPDPDKGESPKKMRTSDKVMVWATCVIAAGTLVSAAAIFEQWREMVRGSGDTTTIADAATKQVSAANRNADAAQRFADTAALISGGIGDAVKKLDAQAKATQDSAAAAKSAAETAKNSFVIGNRPWIKVDLSQTAPLEFLPDGSAKIGIQEKIENVGSSVALDVESWFIILPLGTTTDTFVAAKARQRRECDAFRMPHAFPILEGEEMFPRDPMVYSYAQAIPKDQIVPIRDAPPGMGGQVGQVGFILAGCVTYRSSFEDPTVLSHETLFEYWIAKPAPRGGVIPFLDPSGTHPDYSLFRLQNGLTAN